MLEQFDAPYEELASASKLQRLKPKHGKRDLPQEEKQRRRLVVQKRKAMRESKKRQRRDKPMWAQKRNERRYRDD